MTKKYIINDSTLYLEKIGKDIHVIETNEEKTIKDTSMTLLLDQSCNFYGSSYEGRKKGSENLITESYKLPIIIKENKFLLMFPIGATRSSKSVWINYNNIEEYHQITSKKVLVDFVGGIRQTFNVSYYTFHKQILKCSRLIVVYNNRVM